jgi:serine/threonine protein kinase
MTTPPLANPSALPPGTLVGPWRVEAWCAQGSQGILYRVQATHLPGQGPFALKMARLPEDARFEREGELHSRLHHAHIPRLHQRGEWTSSSGARFPFLVLDWVEGLPLYAFARVHSLSSREVLRVLAQLSSALHAVHEAGGLHRDMKGDNILVRPGGQAMLTDFGACTFRGASTLTRGLPPPGTPQYMSPESQRFQWRFRRHASARYSASPADDVYSLGVTAWRLVTGRYPPTQDDSALGPEAAPVDDLHLPWPALVAPSRHVQLSPELSALICQMLAEEPSSRGSALELTHALERAVRKAPRAADHPITPLQPGATQTVEAPQDSVRSSNGWRWLTGATATWALAASAWAWVHSRPEPPHAVPSAEVSTPAAAGSEPSKRTNLADTGMSEPSTLARAQPTRGGLTLDVPEKPLPGQHRAPCEDKEVSINGGCWWLVAEGTPPCGKRTYAWQKRCYSPSYEPPRPPTSEPP